MAALNRTLLVIGIGAGDPDHLTLQAIKAMNRADVVFLVEKRRATRPLEDLRRDLLAEHMAREHAVVTIEDPDRERDPADYRATVQAWRDERARRWGDAIATNLRGTYLTLHYGVPHLKQAGGGAVVITASVNGTRIFSNAGATAYSSTKAAQVAMTQMLALELAKFRIRVNVVCPGAIETAIDQSTTHRSQDIAEEPVDYPEGKIPLTDGKPGTAEEVAELVAFLSSDRARHITGTPIWIDGAESLLVG